MGVPERLHHHRWATAEEELGLGDLSVAPYIRWARAQARKTRDPMVDPDDFEQEALIALWRAAATHCPAEPLPLSPWAWMHVRSQIFQVKRTLGRQRRARPPTVVSIDDVQIADSREFGPPDDEARHLMREAQLTRLEALALAARLDGHRPREIKKAAGIPERVLDNAFQRAARKLRRACQLQQGEV